MPNVSFEFDIDARVQLHDDSTVAGTVMTCGKDHEGTLWYGVKWDDSLTRYVTEGDLDAETGS
jgi:hypothetical protein